MKSSKEQDGEKVWDEDATGGTEESGEELYSYLDDDRASGSSGPGGSVWSDTASRERPESVWSDVDEDYSIWTRGGEEEDYRVSSPRHPIAPSLDETQDYNFVSTRDEENGNGRWEAKNQVHRTISEELLAGPDSVYMRFRYYVQQQWCGGDPVLAGCCTGLLFSFCGLLLLNGIMFAVIALTTGFDGGW
jgi:hypothetical protein